MKTYFLTATRRYRSETVKLYATDDNDAIVSGALKVMSLAYPNVDLWGNGEIVLEDDHGTVIQRMEEK